MSEQGMNTKDFFIGSLIGGLVGVAAALLYAPKSGRELRENLNEQAKVAKVKTSDWTNQAVEKGSFMASTAKQSTSSFARSVSDQSSVLIDKMRNLSLSVRRDMQELTESADHLVDDMEGISDEIASAVKKEVEDLQKSVEKLVKEVEEKERLKNSQS